MSTQPFMPVPQERTLAYRPGAEIRLPNPIPAIIFIAVMLLGLLVFGTDPKAYGAVIGWICTIVVASIAASSVRLAAQWEKGLVFRLGKFHAVRGPGIYFLMPFIDSTRVVDTRIQTLEIPHRQAITKDNVPVKIDGVIFMRVEDPGAAVIRVQNYINAVQEYAQTTLRDIVGSMTLDEILADRELLGKRVEQMVEQEIAGWGLDVAAIRIQDIELPEDLKRVMARQASAEREKRATITKAAGDREAAENLSAAATMMAKSPGALQLRTLQSLDSLGTSPSNTVVLAIPIEVVDTLRAIPALAKVLGEARTSEPQ